MKVGTALPLCVARGMALPPPRPPAFADEAPPRPDRPGYQAPGTRREPLHT